MSTFISIHSCKRVEAKYGSGEHSKWVDLKFIQSDGSPFLGMTVFFDDENTARAFADAISAIIVIEETLND